MEFGIVQKRPDQKYTTYVHFMLADTTHSTDNEKYLLRSIYTIQLEPNKWQQAPEIVCISAAERKKKWQKRKHKTDSIAGKYFFKNRFEFGVFLSVYLPSRRVVVQIDIVDRELKTSPISVCGMREICEHVDKLYSQAATIMQIIKTTRTCMLLILQKSSYLRDKYLVT